MTEVGRGDSTWPWFFKAVFAATTSVPRNWRVASIGGGASAW